MIKFNKYRTIIIVLGLIVVLVFPIIRMSRIFPGVEIITFKEYLIGVVVFIALVYFILKEDKDKEEKLSKEQDVQESR